MNYNEALKKNIKSSQIQELLTKPNLLSQLSNTKTAFSIETLVGNKNNEEIRTAYLASKAKSSHENYLALDYTYLLSLIYSSYKNLEILQKHLNIHIENNDKEIEELLNTISDTIREELVETINLLKIFEEQYPIDRYPDAYTIIDYFSLQQNIDYQALFIHPSLEVVTDNINCPHILTDQTIIINTSELTEENIYC